MIVIPEAKTVPPSDTIKTNVIAALQGMQETYSDLQYYFYLKKYPKTTVAKFKASVLTFYAGGIRPKILDHIRNLQEVAEKKQDAEALETSEDYIQLVKFLDMYVDRPSRFSIEDCIEIFKWLNQFCEEYGLTKTSFRQEAIPGYE